jgi:predicted  nucleic acid-binding Zn-ribbon protein
MAAPQFVALLELQDLDTTISQLTHRLAHLPEARVVVDLEAEMSTLQARRSAIEADLEQVSARQGAAEAELAATEARIESVSKRLYSGAVTAARDLQAMTADVESLRTRASAIEDRVLEALEERAPLDVAVDTLDKELAALAARHAHAVESLTAAGGQAAADLADAQGRRAEVAAAVPGPLVADYERIRSRSGGVGAARLVGDRCGGCHLTLPSMELDRLRHAPPDTVVHCDECGSILVRP